MIFTSGIYNFTIVLQQTVYSKLNRLNHQCSIGTLRKQPTLGIVLLNDIYYCVQNLGFSVIEITSSYEDILF